MATAFTHGVIGAALASLAPRALRGPRLAIALILVAVLPDLDVTAFRFGIPYAHALGHRGFTHSLAFAALLACLVAALAFRSARPLSRAWWTLVAFLFLACASHGLLDALTDGGEGVGFFIPFDDTRYFLPWRPLRTSPLTPQRFFERDPLGILMNEILWVWLPVALALLIAHSIRLIALLRRP